MSLVTIKCGKCRNAFDSFTDSDGNDFRYRVGAKTIGDEVQLRFNLRRVRCPICGYVPRIGALHEVSLNVPKDHRKSDLQRISIEYPYTSLYMLINTQEDSERLAFTMQEAITNRVINLTFDDEGRYDKLVLHMPGRWRPLESGQWRTGRAHSKVVRNLQVVSENSAGEVRYGDCFTFYTNGNLAFIEKIDRPEGIGILQRRVRQERVQSR